MLIGNAGIITTVSSLILTFVSFDRSDAPSLPWRTPRCARREPWSSASGGRTVPTSEPPRDRPGSDPATRSSSTGDVEHEQAVEEQKRVVAEEKEADAAAEPDDRPREA
jgi:hypothetical protein